MTIRCARVPRIVTPLARIDHDEVATNPKLFGSVARGTAHPGSDIDILIEMDPADGNLLMRASGLMEETRELFGRDDIDVFPVQLLKRPISASAIEDAVAL
ncbi:nucleotidyltransferase family protein [Ruania alba]|uniref:nucleotidyltransferase family protein n=1 Tax=Ruania alba TaxID=648782 RepID=UPI001FE01E4E|nr:nucleotidyltransferase domain-containing protein [Ruania alba]